MGWDIQINPTAEAHGVSSALVALLDGHVQDFHMRYCYLDPSDEAIAALRSFSSDEREDALVVKAMIEELEAGNEVELLIGN
ncbi:MAG TPA: hypothetical protein VEZ14_04655 [Dehalococcoidia bacterium]|nr:hypothetical protein [Dehalococcoidia bacterium]